MSDVFDQKTTDSAMVAKLFGITQRRVQQLATDGVISYVKNKGHFRFDIALVTQQYIKYLQDKLAGRDKTTKVVELEQEKLQVEIDLKRSKARLMEIELKELEGQMHRAEFVEAMTTDLILLTRSMLLGSSSQITVELVTAGIVSQNKAAEADQTIKAANIEILTALSQYQYDPNEYKRRVRERQGWLDEQEESEGDD